MPCHVNEIRLYIIGHNTWKAVNNRNFDNYIILNKNEQQKDLLEFNSTSMLENIFMSDFLLLGFSL